MNKRRILVVDDDADLRETLGEQLRGQADFEILLHSQQRKNLSSLGHITDSHFGPSLGDDFGDLLSAIENPARTDR